MKIVVRDSHRNLKKVDKVLLADFFREVKGMNKEDSFSQVMFCSDYFEYELKQNVLDRYTTLIRKAKADVSIPLIASINCNSSGEWTSYAHKLQQAGADGIELNIMFLGSDPSLSATGKLDSLV